MPEPKVLSEIERPLGKAPHFERVVPNAMDDPAIRAAIEATGRSARRYSTAAGSAEASSISVICSEPRIISTTFSPPSATGSETTA